MLGTDEVINHGEAGFSEVLSGLDPVPDFESDTSAPIKVHIPPTIAFTTIDTICCYRVVGLTGFELYAMNASFADTFRRKPHRRMIFGPRHR
jgi:hypothetical protein